MDTLIGALSGGPVYPTPIRRVRFKPDQAIGLWSGEDFTVKSLSCLVADAKVGLRFDMFGSVSKHE